VQYARAVSDSSLKAKGTFDDSIRINRRQRRKLKYGNHSSKCILTIRLHYRTEVVGEKGETADKGKNGQAVSQRV